MRFLFVGTRPGGGGAERHLIELSSALDGLGHDVAVVVRPGGEIERNLVNFPAVQVFHARFRYASDPKATAALLQAVRAFRPDWLIASMPHEYYSAAAVARLTGTKLTLFEHTDLPTRPLTNFMLPRIADRFVVPSHYLRSHLLERGMPDYKVDVLHNPVDVDRLHPDGEQRTRMRQRHGFAPEHVVVGYVGRIEEAKGCHILSAALQKAMSRNERLRALWIGDGPYRKLAEQEGEYGKHTFTGWVTDASPHYHAMDVLALPTTKAETFGRASIEAQAVGVPVLGSKLGGIPETMEPGRTGLLLPPGDIDAWTAAILRITDPQLRIPLAQEAPDFVTRKFAARSIARQFIALLNA